MKVALFGGAFDPPHLGHRLVADQLIKNKVVDEVWFVPVFIHPWAKSLGKYHLVDYSQRVKMLELQLGEFHRVAHFRDVSFTYDTLKYFSLKFPSHQFSWVMGSEYVSKFDLFLDMHPLLIEYQFYIYPRFGYSLKATELHSNMKLIKNVKEIDISSTQVRDLIVAYRRDSRETGFQKFVTPEVGEFIIDQGLYG